MEGWGDRDFFEMDRRISYTTLTTICVVFWGGKELRDDTDIVRAAVSHGGLEQWQYASLRLQADPDIVRQAFASAGNSLFASPHPPPPIPFFSALEKLHPEFHIVDYITPENALMTLKVLGKNAAMMQEQPEIPTRVVQVCPVEYLRSVSEHIPNDLWARYRPLCMAWLQRGGRVLEAFKHLLDVQLLPYKPDDIELPLAVARYSRQDMHKVGRCLLRDRSFVLQALELDGRIFRCVAPELLQEVDVQIMAVANYYNHVPAGTDTTGEQYLGCYMDVAALARHIHQRLQIHEIFCHDFWGAIAATPPPRPLHRPLSQAPPPPWA